MPNDLGISTTDNNLLEDLAQKEGLSVMEMLEMDTFDSVAHGICASCRGTQECEPDARSNWCDCCGENNVRSSLDIAGII